MSPVVKKKMLDLNDRQIDILKVLKRAPKTNTATYDALVKKRAYITKQAVRSCTRTLENRGLVRARSKWDKKLKRDVIVWEITDKGRKALDK